jgi:hypothetical protein
LISNWHNKVIVCLFLLFNGLLFISPAWTDQYESRPTANATELLSGDLLQSAHHRIEGIDINGELYQFDIDSEFGVYHVESMTLLGIRINEIKTLAQAINQFEVEDNQFSNKLRSQLHVSGESAMDIITSPFGTASQLAGQMADNFGDTLAGVDVLAEKNDFKYENIEPADAIAATHKRNIAYQLGLDAYSTNENVQAFLNTVTKARKSGRISAGVVMLKHKPPSKYKVANGRLEMAINLKLKNNSISDLILVNDQILSNIKIEQELRGKFLRHPIYSPRHLTAITTYLNYLEGVRNRDAVISLALSAEREVIVLSYVQLVRMLALYHEQIDSLRKLHVLQGVTSAITKGGGIAFFVTDEILYWTEETNNKYHALAEKAKASGFTEIKLVILGITTTVAKRNLTNMGFVLNENFLGMIRG